MGIDLATALVFVVSFLTVCYVSTLILLSSLRRVSR